MKETNYRKLYASLYLKPVTFLSYMKDGDYIVEFKGNVIVISDDKCYLNEEEIGKITEICNDTFVNFIKTSTGFGSRGVSLEDIDIINRYKNSILEIKASGGIHDEKMIEELLNKGVTRFGISNIDFLRGDKK